MLQRGKKYPVLVLPVPSCCTFISKKKKGSSEVERDERESYEWES